MCCSHFSHSCFADSALYMPNRLIGIAYRCSFILASERSLGNHISEEEKPVAPRKPLVNTPTSSSVPTFASTLPIYLCLALCRSHTCGQVSTLFLLFHHSPSFHQTLLSTCSTWSTWSIFNFLSISIAQTCSQPAQTCSNVVSNPAPFSILCLSKAGLTIQNSKI